MQSHVIFDTSIGRQKPQTYTKKEIVCPFCSIEDLEDIIDTDGAIILLKNKFPVLKETLQTVIIESDVCQSDLSVYPKDHLYRLLRFGINKWFDFMKDPTYKSVVYFRNFGPQSGGTIAHPHSQIVCFENYNYLENIHSDNFIGLPIDEKNGVLLNISKKPRIGFVEFNVSMRDIANIEVFGDYIQTVAHFILNNYPYRCSSYNIFYYYFNGEIIAKIVPRFVTTPLFIGYSIQQVSNNLEEIATMIRTLYLK